METDQNAFSRALFNDELSAYPGSVLYRSGPISRVRVEEGVAICDFPWLRVSKLIRTPSYAPSDSPAEKEGRLRISACGDHVVRVTMGDGGGDGGSPMLALSSEAAGQPLQVETLEHGWRLFDEQGRTRAVIDHTMPVLRNWNGAEKSEVIATLHLDIFPDGRTRVPLNAVDRFGDDIFDSLPLYRVEHDGVAIRSGFALKASPDETFHGTGERFTRLDLAGRTMLLSNADGLGVNSPRTYKCVPFYLSSRPYGLFVHTSYHARLSLADLSTRSVIGMLDDPQADLFVIGGGTPAQILRHYRSLTGFPPEPPAWSYGTWMGRMSYFSADEVNGIADRLRKEDYPCDVLHIDTGWFEKDWVCEWRFSPERFPDPAGFMQKLRDRGFRVTLWQTPYLGKANRLLAEARKKGFIGRGKGMAGSDQGSDFSGIDIGGHIDFSNPEAVAWYKDLLRNLLRMGASAIKTDFGEDIQDADYMIPKERLHNLYALLYQKAAFEVTEEVTGDSIIWARAGWAGCQRYPVHWDGDAECTWDGMAGALRGGLHLGMSGFAFWAADVPGFHGTPHLMHSEPSDELFVRWTQLGVLSSHLRFHGTTPREPWEFPAVSDIIRSWLKLRYALIPYIMQQASNCCRSGMPVLRALLLHDPEDPTCRHIDDAYMLGDELLVAPVMNPEGVRHVYLPEGEWVDFWTGERRSGSVWLRDVESPLHSLPLFVRAGASIPVYPLAVPCTGDMDWSRVVHIVFDGQYPGFHAGPLGALTGLPGP